jgi:hypothetical protein
MIYYVEIGGKKHPFKFGMRELFALSQQWNVQPETPEATLREVSMDFDAFLEAFILANKKGCRKHTAERGEEIEALTAESLEDALDDDPDLFTELNKVLEKSMPKPEAETKAGKLKA